eukprot:300389-Rhodomonas_salina.2
MSLVLHCEIKLGNQTHSENRDTQWQPEAGTVAISAQLDDDDDSYPPPPAGPGMRRFHWQVLAFPGRGSPGGKFKPEFDHDFECKLQVCWD